MQLQRSLIWLSYEVPFTEDERLPCLSREERPVGPDILATVETVQCLFVMIVHFFTVEMTNRAHGGLRLTREHYRHLSLVMQCAADAATALSNLVRRKTDVDR